MSDNVLIVDDDPLILKAYKRQLRTRFSVETAESGLEGLKILQSGRQFAVIVADMKMPEMNGIELLIRVQEVAPDTVRMMLTGNADQETAVKAVNEGQVYRFLNKPCSPELMTLALEIGIEHYRNKRREKDLLENTLLGSVTVLTQVLALSAPEILGWAEQRRKYLLKYLETDGDQIKTGKWELETATLLASIGSVSLPESLRDKVKYAEELHADEQEMLDNIPNVGYDLLHRIPRLETIAQIVKYQGKHYDGSGIPEDEISGKDIPEGARILKVLTDLVELEAKGCSRKEAYTHMSKREGFYDPYFFEQIIGSVELEKQDAPRHMAKLLELELHEIRCGDVLKSGIYTVDGILVIRPGTQINLVMLHRLRNFTKVHKFRSPITVER